MTKHKYLALAKCGHVSIITFSSPPRNYFNAIAIKELFEAMSRCDEDNDCRAIVLCAEGKVFCAGGEFGRGEAGSEQYTRMATDLYAVAMKLFEVRKPIVAAVQGAAIGGGLGLALVADFRVTCESAKFCANFTQLGIHPGFGTTVTLPRVVGVQAAQMMFYTGRRINGAEALRIGLADKLVEQNRVKDAAIELAQEIAAAAPLAVQDTRESFRQGLAEKIAEANRQELLIQKRHMLSRDFFEGVAAMADRRSPVFLGK